MSKAQKEGYTDKTTLEAILFNIVENSFQTDDTNAKLDIIIELQTKTNILLQTFIQTSQQNTLAEKQPVNTVNLQVLQPVERPSKVLQRALDWLSAHPERLQETSRNLAAEIGVSHTTVAKAQQLIRADYSAESTTK